MGFDTTKIYVISSATGNPQDVVFIPQNPCTTDDTPVTAVTTASQPKWRLTETQGGSNVYAIALADDSTKRIFVEGGLLWLSSTEVTELSIEPAGSSGGDAVYRMHVPNDNNVTRLPSEGAQITIAAEDGTNSELWFFDAWAHA